MEESDKRNLFIKNIGLNHDPFETPVAEQELRRVQNRFYSYFFSPLSSASKEELISRLRLAQHAFIFGHPGSGKSTLRLTLEADCRTILDGSLTVTHILGENLEHTLSYEEHGERLAQVLTIDLTLSIIEQFNPITPPSEEQIEMLRTQIPTGGRQLKRLLRMLLEKLDNSDPSVIDPVWGISKDWHIIGKAPVKYVGSSKKLSAFIKRLVDFAEDKKNANWNDFWQGIEVAQKWGFNRYFVLIDGVDTKQRTPKEMMELIAPLFNIIRDMEKKSIFLKFFLPLDLKEILDQYLQTIDKNLLSSSFSSIMKWNDSGLRRLLAQRFRAATPRSGLTYTGLDSLATPNLNLDENLIRTAEGSPRRLLELVSDLIDIHITRNPDSLQFNQEDWEIYRQKTEKNTPV